MLTTTRQPPALHGSTDIAAGASPVTGRRRWLGPRATVTVLTIVALGVRLIITRGFWLDEATQGYDSRLSFHGMLLALTHDNHPPLDYTLLWAVAHTVGSTETDLRLPSIIFGTLTVPMLYLAGKALYHERVGVLAATFGTFGAIAVWYSQEARMYALFMLLATVTIWAQSRALSRNRTRYWLAWAAAASAMIWTQWFAALAVGAEVLYFAAVIASRRHDPARRRQLGRLALAIGGVAVTVAPGLPLLLTQFHNNQANGLGFGEHASAASAGGASPYGIFNNLVWALWGYHSNGVVAGVVAVWPLGILVVLLFLGRARHRSNRQLVTLIVVPMTIVFVASANASPSRSLFEVRYFIEAVPALYLLLAGLAYNMAPSVRARRILAGVLVATFVTGLALQQTDGHNPRLYGYTAAFDQISSVARPGDEIVYSPTYLNVDVAYYEPSMKAAPVTGGVPAVPRSAHVFVVGSFPFSGTSADSAQARALVSRLERTRHLQELFQAPNVTVWELS